jgi:hypothetical protein
MRRPGPDGGTGSSTTSAASATELPEGAGGTDGKGLPAGAAQGRTDFGSAGFGGACPPKGDKPHRYIFTVHALKTDKIEVPADASAALVGFMVNANRLAKASFEARYGANSARRSGARQGTAFPPLAGSGRRHRVWMIAMMLPSLSLNQAAFAPPAVTTPLGLFSPGMS